MAQTVEIFFKVSEASRYAGLGERAIYGLIRRGKFPVERCFRKGTLKHKIPVQKLGCWLEEEIIRYETRLNFLKQSNARLQEVIRHVYRA